MLKNESAISIQDPAIRGLMHGWTENGNQLLGAKLATTSKEMGKIDLRTEGSNLPEPLPLLTQYRIGRNAIIAGIRQQIEDTIQEDLAERYLPALSADDLQTQISTIYRFNPVFMINYEEPEDPEERNDVSSRLEDWLAYFGLPTRGNELEYLLFNTLSGERSVATALDDYLEQIPNEEDPAALEVIKQKYYKAILQTLQAQNLPDMPQRIPEPGAANRGGKHYRQTLKRNKRRTKKNRRSKSRRHLRKNNKRKTKRR
jgi:hypothetical protein